MPNFVIPINKRNIDILLSHKKKNYSYSMKNSSFLKGYFPLYAYHIKEKKLVIFPFNDYKINWSGWKYYLYTENANQEGKIRSFEHLLDLLDISEKEVDFNLFSFDIEKVKFPERGTEEEFIFRYGYHNCKQLTFLSKDEIIKALVVKKGFTYHEFSKDFVEFIDKIQNKKVLCCLEDNYIDNTDVLTFPDENFLFCPECFVEY